MGGCFLATDWDVFNIRHYWHVDNIAEATFIFVVPKKGVLTITVLHTKMASGPDGISALLETLLIS